MPNVSEFKRKTKAIDILIVYMPNELQNEKDEGRRQRTQTAQQKVTVMEKVVSSMYTSGPATCLSSRRAWQQAMPLHQPTREPATR